MASSISPSAKAGNRLLDALPATVRARLLRSCELVSLPVSEVICRRGQEPLWVHFPTTAVLSMLCVLESGVMVETGMVGREGMSGMATCLGVAGSALHTIVQVPGASLRIPASTLKKEFDRGGALHDLLLRYISTIVVQLSQAVGCNARHVLTARLSRWILTVRDRIDTDELRLEHKFLSQMLGTGRGPVTVAAGSLKMAGLIRYARGRITVLDRAGLEASSCECYGVVAAAADGARLGPDAAGPSRPA